MADLNETPRANRIRIAFFGLRNAGKSTLVNAFTGQPIAIVSDVAGTTTDPVSKAMEILPLGPCLVTDTAGLDDEGELGTMRVEKTLDVLATTDIAVWVWGSGASPLQEEEAVSNKAAGRRFPEFVETCRKRNVPVIEYRRGDSVEELKKKIAAVKLEDAAPGLLDGLVEKGDRVLCVVPIDESAPKGRLILPQQQVIRECLDRGAVVMVCGPEDVRRETEDVKRAPNLVVTDSQAFGKVKGCCAGLRLTSFSVLFARQKGDLQAFAKGLEAIKGLKDGDRVLVAEGCTHHRQCNDIGSVKIPKALEKISGKKLNFEFSSGGGFSDLGTSGEGAPRLGAPSGCCAGGYASPVKLVVHCGGCMLTRREMLRRIELAKAAGIPIVNYGLVLAKAGGLKVEDLLI